jgi:hypothetical protein
MADNRDARGDQPLAAPRAAQGLRTAQALQSTQAQQKQNIARTQPKASPRDGADKTIVVRDRRKPNQYTTNNIIAREWLPILRVGDAFFFYSIYLSMANRETESSWGSLRTQAKYLQCGVDLIVRGNKLLEICELIYIDTGNYRTTNEYYILEPPPLTPELKARINDRLDTIAACETSVNWQSWVKQVRKALRRHRSLPSIWAERRSRRGGRPVKTVRAQSAVPAKNSARESQAPFYDRQDKGACDSRTGIAWPTTRALVSHNQGERVSQPEQDLITDKHEQDQEKKESTLALVREWCCQLGIANAAVEVLLERHSVDRVLQQMEWLSFRNPRDPAAMLVSAIQGDWDRPARCSGGNDLEWSEKPGLQVAVELIGLEDKPDIRSADERSGNRLEQAGQKGNGFVVPGTEMDARDAWGQVLDELRLQMTRATFDTWLGGAAVVGVSEVGVTVLARDPYAAEWLQSRWRMPIRRTMSGIVGHEVDVRFVAPEGMEA